MLSKNDFDVSSFCGSCKPHASHMIDLFIEDQWRFYNKSLTHQDLQIMYTQKHTQHCDELKERIYHLEGLVNINEQNRVHLERRIEKLEGDGRKKLIEDLQSMLKEDLNV